MSQGHISLNLHPDSTRDAGCQQGRGAREAEASPTLHSQTQAERGRNKPCLTADHTLIRVRTGRCPVPFVFRAGMLEQERSQAETTDAPKALSAVSHAASHRSKCQSHLRKHFVHGHQEESSTVGGVGWALAADPGWEAL